MKKSDFLKMVAEVEINEQTLDWFDKKWLSAIELAKYLGITVPAIYQMFLPNKEITYYRFLGKKMLFKKEHIDEFIISKTVMADKKNIRDYIGKPVKEEKQWLSVDELSKYLDISKSLIYKLTGSDPQINFYRIGERKIVFNRAEIDDIVEQGIHIREKKKQINEKGLFDEE
jgi:excisionase family DNA binding protein